MSKSEQNLEELKVKVARDLGLYEKVESGGWGSLTSAESGRVGGYMNRILKQQRSDVDGVDHTGK